MQCEICGKRIERGIKVKIEGSQMQVCRQCSNLGTKLDSNENKTSRNTKKGGSSRKVKKGKGGKSREGKSRSSRGSFYDQVGELVRDYPSRIREAREKRNLKQEELAKEINEKASLIGKLERGDKLPEEKVVKKLENFLNIGLKER